MRRLFVAVGAWTLVYGLIGRAADQPSAAPGAPIAPDIQSLVEQLGSDHYADREAAASRLERMPAVAIPALKAATTSENPEVRERAARLLVKLNRLADSGRRLSPRRVRLDYQDIPLGTALNDLRGRTGLPLVLDPVRVADPLRRITCRTEELPLWEAVEAFCAAAGLREVFVPELEIPNKSQTSRRGYVPPFRPPAADAVPIVLVDGTPEKLPGDRSTAVRVLALPPEFTGHRTTLGTGEVDLCLDVTPAPGLNWREVTAVKVTRLVDSQGRTGGAGVEKNVPTDLNPNVTVLFARGVVFRFDMGGEPIYPEHYSNPRVFTVPLLLGDPNASRIRRLEGSVFGVVQVQDQPVIVIDDLKNNTGRWIDGPGDLRAFVIGQQEEMGSGTGVIRVQVGTPSPWAVNPLKRGGNPVWPVPPNSPGQLYRVELWDESNKPIPASSSAAGEYTDNSIRSIFSYTVTFRLGSPKPAKVVVIGPRLVTVEIPFVMENIRLR